METQIRITIHAGQQEVYDNQVSSTNHPYKKCPYCGQDEIPFKKGVCVCGKQVGNIQYVNDPKSFAKQYYEYKINVNEKYDPAVEDTFNGLEEIE